MRYFVQIEGKEHVADVTELPGGGFDVRLCDADGNPVRTVDVDVSTGTSSLAIRVDGRMFDLVLDDVAPKPSVFASGRRPAIVVENAHQRAAASVRKDSGGDGGGVVTVTDPDEGSGRCGVGVTPGCDVCGRGSVDRAGCGCEVGRELVVDSCGFGAIGGGPRSGGVTVGAGNEGPGCTGGAIGVSAGAGATTTRDAVSDQRLKPAIASAITTTTPTQIHARLFAGAASVAGVVVDRCSAAGVTCVRVTAASEPDSRSRRMRLSSASRSDAC